VVDQGVARRAWQVSAEDRYKDPGRPVVKPRFGGGPAVIMQVADSIYLEGDGGSPQGDRPFLDRFNVKTFDTERLYQCEGERYETVAAVLADNGRTLLTRYETVKQPPNYLVRDLTKRTERAVTAFTDPAPQLSGVARLQEGRAPAAGDVGLPARVHGPGNGGPGVRVAVSLHDLCRPLAHVLPDAGVRRARQPVDADRRPG
jgi:dipeptidyl aminopeptidase/acylaminoacyl peptidase